MAESRHSSEGSCRSTGTAEQAWALWTDPAQWPGGPIERAEMRGAFEVGAEITTKVRGERPLTTKVARIDKPHMWVGSAKWPGLKMDIEHVIDPVDGGVLLTERSVFSGPLAPLVARVLRRRLERIYSETTAHAADVIETRFATGSGRSAE